jgi:hypothetical protein
MSIKDIFQPLCPFKYQEFVDCLYFDENIDWNSLSPLEHSEVIVHFLLISEVSVSDIINQISKLTNHV